jgi:hypothetical protein
MSPPATPLLRRRKLQPSRHRERPVSTTKPLLMMETMERLNFS